MFSELKNVYFWIITLVNFSILFYLFLLSPYDYGWDETLKRPSADKIPTIEFISVLILSITIIFIYYRQKFNKFQNCVTISISVFAAALFINAFSISQMTIS